MRSDVCMVRTNWDFAHHYVSDIEELTRKTGNFKQFSIFLNMLESAITKSSDSVALDLLTFADLEALRKSKFGSGGGGGGRGLTPGKTKAAHAKRYLILTYSVEFDRSVGVAVCVCTPFHLSTYLSVYTLLHTYP